MAQPIVLIGGVSGTGKSTVADLVARRIDTRRVVSSDLVRAAMRPSVPVTVAPELHCESFEVQRWGEFAASATLQGVPEGDPLVEGFARQAVAIAAGTRAMVDHCRREGWAAVFEGVHLVPGMLGELSEGTAHFVLCVRDEQRHRQLFFDRELASAGGRAAAKYHDNLAAIRQIQTYLVARARACGAVVVDAESAEAAADAIVQTAGSAH